ncbi:PREDICTED: protein jagged-1b-like isoform X2 [Cyprinodon variegatus]|uniref:protein jagged-1b-like isoform X2 n=1 Tax=Cyprinodon variegatus TaxID=28743 RepID=UPI000742671C|nr:PREDICTED: protein jagged-1b-like isoform X2 [Cyprinodon variegatus]
MTAGMESTKAHKITLMDPGNGGERIRRTHLHLQRTVVLLAVLTVQPQAVCSAGMFELQIRHFHNPHGFLQTGNCCDLQASGGQHCSARDQCDTFFYACLKEYQARVVATGACTFGSGTTGVLGGNSHSPRHRGHDAGGGGGGGREDGTHGHISIPFKYAWPKSFSLVLEALDHDNDTTEPGQLIERVLLSSMLNPGEQWQTYRHHGQILSLEYWLRFRCDSNYYGPFCNKFCRARDDFFGHFSCDPSGTKVCMEGWTGPECKEAVCRQGCHQNHGFCTVPGECKCHYGWKGPLCDQCVTFPGCVYGSCTEPWQCVCDVNWGGLLCDKDLNYCGTHQPCKNGGTCTNTEPNEYKCDCQEGFKGRNCDIVEHACLSSPCMNGATCVEDPNSFSCICAEGWTGNTCADAVKQCDRNPCGRGATCQEAPGGFRCLCPLGWTGRTCQLDANECEMGTCVHARSCHNLIGSYLCDCLPGWTGPNCDIRNSSCQGLCLNGGHCEDQLSGSRCVCPTGFTGKHCQNGLDPCDTNPCLHDGQCVMKDGKSATCDCPVGYSGLFCEIENDPCSPNPCQQGVQCQSSEGRPVCTCPDGYYGNECVSLRKPCIGQDCQGAMSDTAHSGLSIYMILLGILALVTICCCIVCTVVLSRLHRKRTKQQSVPQEESINNQREFVNLIRNVERPPGPNLSPASTQPHPPAPVSRCYEEIELTIPPSPAPSHPSPALKPAHAPKMDISNREREKLNRFHCTDNQELEV